MGLIPFFRHRGILGLNARNLLYVKPFNPRKAVAFADDKMKTKAFLSARGIPTARVFARIENRRQLRAFDFSALPDECVLKPNNGFGGEGILIFRGRRRGQFLEQGRRPVPKQELIAHIEDILDGKFSVTGRSDTAFFEQILVADECFVPLRPAGLPDIRIIVFNLVPVMAMLRIPTAESGGKANVHLGGVGIGIDMGTGTTTFAAQYNHLIETLPHGMRVAGFELPHWDEMLLIASRIQSLTNIGFLAVDLTIDRTLGPVLLEVNARAGLMVQVANLAPLRSRLERVAGLSVTSPEKGVRLAKELFGSKGESRDEPEEKRPVVGMTGTITMTGDGFSMQEPCEIAPDIDQTTFHPSLIRELVSKGIAEKIEDTQASYRVKFELEGEKMQTVVREGSAGTGRARIGRRDLKGFLIDPSRKEAVPSRVSLRTDLRAADRLLASVDRSLPVLKFLRPINLHEEAVRLQVDPEGAAPIFLYPPLPDDLDETEAQLRGLEMDDTPLGSLLRKKKRELLMMIEMLRSRGDSEKFTAASLALYGTPSTALVGYASRYVADEAAVSSVSEAPESLLNASQTCAAFEEALKQYGLHEWSVTKREGQMSDCSVGEHRIFVRSDATFSELRIRSLIAHEIEIHALTAENGAAQPYELFRRGCANYLDTQEGLAIWSQMRVLPPGHEKRLRHARSVLAVAYALEHPFSELRAYLEHELGFSADRALRKALELKRGLSDTEETGACTRALVYFRGYRAIQQFVESGNDVAQLFVGKIALEDLPLIEKVEGIRPPLILPTFLRSKTPSASPTKSRKPRKPVKKA